ncbi:MAG: lysophospholipid acyltransferase family protein [Steroidobacteraceae bacterium]|jgi:KDO2-lipid IV(A) lauroyltransferase
MLKVFSRVPFWALYGLAAFVAWLAFHVLRHRSHVIEAQLVKVFPALGAEERRGIHRQFLRNYCQVMVEILKSASMPEASIAERVQIVNLPTVRADLDAGRSIMFMTSHMNNWEWLLQGVTVQLGYPVDAAYKPIRDPRGERLLLELRSRCGARLVPAKDLLSDHLRRRNIVHALAINADQAPAQKERHQWTRFLGQDTAFYVGAEQIARATRLPIFYASMRRVRRGYYAVTFTPLWDGRERTEPGELTERYARACEADVLERPADWLWTYRRWRFAKPLYGA